MKLLLDIGNSRCKWAVLEEGVWLRQGAVPSSELATLAPLFSSLPVPQRILVANVAGAAAEQAVRALCAPWPVPPEFLVAEAEQCGVRNAYREPQQLGIDRWLSLLAAWHELHAACVVVNCGTATTIDALSKEGEFLGGLILPGLELMRRSLLEGTAQLASVDGQVCRFPRTTADAVASGAVFATAGAIALQRQRLGSGVPCVLSGGAAAVLRPWLGAPLHPVDNLVLRGLQRIGET